MNNRGIPGIPRGRGGFGRGGRGRGGFGPDHAARGGNRGRGRGGPNQRGGHGQPTGIPQDEIPLGAGGPPTAVPQIALQALPEGDYQPKGSRARRIERRKDKNSKGKQKAEAAGDVGGGDDEIIEIDFNDMGQVFGPAPGATISSTPAVTVPANPTPPQYPIQTQSQNTNRGGALRGRGRGRGGRGGVQAADLPGQGGFLSPVVNNSGYGHTDFDLQQYAYTATGQSSSFQSSSRGGGPSSQPRYNQNAQPQSFRAGFGGRRNGANFRGFTYDDDDNDPSARALRNIARKGLTESNNMYLRPIKFVKSAAVLFQDQEEIFAAEVADNNNANSGGAAPTADRVEQVFHGGVKPGSGLAEEKEKSGSDSESDSEDDSEDDSPKEGDKPVEAPVVEAAKAPLPRLEVATLVEATARLEVTPDPDDDGDDIVLLTPSRPRGTTLPSPKPPTTTISALEQIKETKVLVTSDPEVKVSQTEVTTEITMEVEPAAGPSTSSQPPQHDTTSDELIATLLQVEEDSKVTSVDANESKMLHILTGRKRTPKQQRSGGGKRARQDEQAKGKGKSKGKVKEKINWNARPKFRNEDVNWSTASSEAEGKDEDDDDDDALGGMDVDPDLAGPSHDAQYAAFVNSIVRGAQENQVSAADLEAEAAMEDTSEEEAKIPKEKKTITAKKRSGPGHVVEVVEGDDDGDDAWTDASDSDEMDDEIKAGKTRMVVDNDEDEDSEEEEDSEDDDEDEEELFQQFEWDEDDEDENLVTTIQQFLDDNEDILKGGRKMKKQRRKLYENLRDLVQDDELIQATMEKKRKKKKRPDWVPPDLADQWERDRQKKAENKRKRAEARRAALAEETPGKKRNKKLKIRLETMEDDSDEDSDLEFELEDGRGVVKVKKGKKKAKDPSKPKVDVWKIGRQISGFVSDIKRDSLQLPPMDKDSRRRVHEIANLYKLNSQSSGKGDSRATTLRRSQRTILNVNERKLDAKLKGWEAALLGGGKAGKAGKGAGKGDSGKHREGDIVGQHAAKIGSENAGYQLLQMMGWSEGDRMGMTGGLEAPIHAVFKATKLGLGSI